jgi:hypothetical protein
MTLDCLPGLEAQLAEMKTMLIRIEGQLTGPKEPRGGTPWRRSRRC